jgi:oxalate---CoA ligase
VTTIHRLLETGASSDTALLAPDCDVISYDAMRGVIDRLAGQLRAVGVSSGDRVGIVLPNGPEMALTFLAVSACATAAPLNPRYREDEFRFYLEDLGAKVLITRPGEMDAAHAAAPAGTVKLGLAGTGAEAALQRSGMVVNPVAPVWSSPEHVALVLHTSGTTSRPKIVPLRHENLVASASNIVSSLHLGPTDRCLNVMPLFHIHGLVAGLLAPLSAGGSVVCPAGFDPFKFFDWLDRFGPTWYTAVPTMHQVILSRAERHRDVIARASMRFVRSSSAALPTSVLEKVCELFRAPVIEAYGMTEASHQMTSNPLPPDVQKPGSVGRGTGIEVAIMDEAGSLLPRGKPGEVVIKGRTVLREYESNPEANAKAFTNGWFRTGDQGYLDEDGYLFLTGRLKEIINRGGEKISPLEIDEVLLRHPAVAQAVAFAMPHDRLGEEVAAAVVLADGAEATERDLRDFAASRLADFKVPRKVVFLQEIPKGPTGKLQRIGLAARLGLAS